MKCSLDISNFLEEILFPFYCFPLFLCIDHQGRLSYLSLLFFWNSVFKWVYLSFSPLPLASLLFSVTYKSSSDDHFAFLHFFFLGIVLITASCTMSRTSIHNSSGTPSIFIAKFRLKLKKVGKTTRPFRYDLNQIPYSESDK